MSDDLSSSEPTAPPQADSRARVPWNPWIGVFLVLAIFYVSQIVGGLLISIYPSLKGWTTDQANTWLTNSVSAQFVYTLLAEAFTIGAIVLFIRRYKLGLTSIGLKKPRRHDLMVAVAAVPAYYGLYLAVITVATKLVPGINVDQHQDIGFNSVHGVAALVLTFVSLAVLPPLAEEIMVRGFLYSSLKKAVPTVWAVVLTSALFAAAHLPEGGAGGPLWIAAIDTFTLSLVLIYLREKTGSLWASIGLHAIKNSIAFFALFVFAGH